MIREKRNAIPFTRRVNAGPRLVIHWYFSNEDLRYFYNTLEIILDDENIQSIMEVYKYKADDCIFSIKRIKKNIRKSDRISVAV